MKYYKRGFLNKNTGMAAFDATLIQADWKDSVFEGEFCITDCNRKVALEFSFHNKSTYKEQMYKLDKLISELAKFRDAMIAVKVNVDE